MAGTQMKSLSSQAKTAAPRAVRGRRSVVVQAAKELHFNKNMEALKRMQAGVDKLATVVGVTIGPKVSISKENCTIVGDGRTAKEVEARVKQIRNLAADTEQEYEKEKLNERIARLSGGVAIIQVGAQTETELKEKKLRVEDALNATKAAVEEGVVIGGGCTLLRLAQKVDAIKLTLDGEEQRMGADIIKRALSYPIKLIANNAGVNGSVVMQNVMDHIEQPHYGYNAATDKFEDLMEAGIIDPTKVVRCSLENAVSVAKTFLLADVVVTEIPEREKAPAAAPAGDYDY
ncbi:RuBisCO large subunit-binding protein subunit beta-2 [Tetrabaena socialis]|uniref:RuBisCO large subunit-binding protein subunit beta-2 n=1 Tax=Tetrabaena socialis TaxID=47790 RepID=A0A2J8A8J8_9CHLO|nr:RuBisCO large subunit-binding protein subunit beta-2 [Tetrabaena socialis]|eukprot:PNH08847.1 RuBisCO large subunit-binding protein subunit beta-2 [Tetrabaena socialis]